MTAALQFLVGTDLDGSTLAAVLRCRLNDQSWNQVRKMVVGRRVHVNGDLCLDPARRLHAGESLEIASRPARKPNAADAIVIRHLDTHIVVVEKPSGIATVRHPSERDWSARRKALHPTLNDLVPRLIAREERGKRKGPLPRLRVVHRLDKETSGLVIFARTVAAERELGKQFRRHTILRRYVAIILGDLAPQTITTRLVRDRGDGRRGSSTNPTLGKEAITHVEAVQKLDGCSLITCRLQTGRTHQIRIHLSELGHPICGEKVYHRDVMRNIRPDMSGAPRLALHAAELGITHPVSGETRYWEMPLPPDLATLLAKTS